jgi:hypothetical protein
MLSHRQYSHALRSKERYGTRETQGHKRVKLIKNHSVLLRILMFAFLDSRQENKVSKLNGSKHYPNSICS